MSSVFSAGFTGASTSNWFAELLDSNPVHVVAQHLGDARGDIDASLNFQLSTRARTRRRALRARQRIWSSGRRSMTPDSSGLKSRMSRRISLMSATGGGTWQLLQARTSGSVEELGDDVRRYFGSGEPRAWWVLAWETGDRRHPPTAPRTVERVIPVPDDPSSPGIGISERPGVGVGEPQSGGLDAAVLLNDRHAPVAVHEHEPVYRRCPANRSQERIVVDDRCVTTVRGGSR